MHTAAEYNPLFYIIADLTSIFRFSFENIVYQQLIISNYVIFTEKVEKTTEKKNVLNNESYNSAAVKTGELKL